MKSFFRFCLVAFTAAVIFSSCSKSNDEGKMIPNNAVFITSLNTKSLNSKLSWEEIKQTNWFKHFYADDATADWMKKLMDDPEKSGIDIKANAVFFVQASSGNNYNLVFEGSVKDEKAFAEFNKNLDPASTIKKDGEINLLPIKGKSVVGWNGKRFAYVSNSNSLQQAYRGEQDNQTNMGTEAEGTTSMLSFCKNLFSLKSDSSLAKNEKYANLIADNGDIHTWINYEELIKNNAALGMLGMLKLDLFFKDNISTYTVSFDDGQVNVQQKSYAGKDFTDFLKKYEGNNLNADMISSIPSQDVAAVFAMNYKPEGLKQLLTMSGLDGFLNSFIGQMGFSINDFVSANNGDLMVALTDLKLKTDSMNYQDDQGNPKSMTSIKPDLNYLFSVGIGDKQSFQKLMEAGKKISGEMGGGINTKYNLNDKTFAVGSDQAMINQYLKGGKNKFDFSDKLTGHPIGLFIDIHKILTVANSDITKTDEDAKMMMDESLKIWKNVFFTGGEFKNGAINANTEINLMDQSVNSLKQLNQYFDKISKAALAKIEREKSSHEMTDSMMMPPPIDTVPVDTGSVTP
ncbi:MAG: DUF4836 family protein [Ginsengibacter sp.]